MARGSGRSLFHDLTVVHAIRVNIQSAINMESTASDTNHKLAFVEKLAQDLNRGNIELPSFPDIVLRIRKALEDENCTTEKLVQLIGAEPVLAARLLSIANSAALQPSGDPITDLNMAVTRIGRTMIRSSAMSFAMTQLQNAAKLDAVKAYLEAIWEQCAYVASLCYVVSRKYTKLNADEAMFVGLMHGIGKMYVLVQAESFPDLFQDPADMFKIMDEWDAAIGSSIVENWGFAEHVSEAVKNYNDAEWEHDGTVSYTDVLIVAYLLYQFTSASEDAEFDLDNVPASRQLNITAGDMIAVLEESEEMINSLRRALGK